MACHHPCRPTLLRGDRSWPPELGAPPAAASLPTGLGVTSGDPTPRLAGREHRGLVRPPQPRFRPQREASARVSGYLPVMQPWVGEDGLLG